MNIYESYRQDIEGAMQPHLHTLEQIAGERQTSFWDRVLTGAKILATNVIYGTQPGFTHDARGDPLKKLESMDLDMFLRHALSAVVHYQPAERIVDVISKVVDDSGNFSYFM